MKLIRVELKDISDVIAGQSPPSKFYNETGSGVPFFQGRTEFGDFYPTVKKFTTKVTKLARAGDILFTVRAPVGDINIAKTDCCIGRGLASIRSHENNNFIYYLIINNIASFLTKASGAIYDSINKNDLEGTCFEIPKDKGLREKIASILSAYDDLIENNLKRIKLLEEAAQLLYRQWFVDFKFPGYEKTRFIKGIPEGWEEKPLNEVCHLTMGQSPKSIYYNQEAKGLPFHQGVTRFGSRFVSHETYCTQANRIAEQGDILCSVRAPVGRLNISLDKIIIGRGLSAIRNKNGFQSFQYYQLKNYFFQENIIGSGAIFASVTKKQMETIPFLTPTNDILAKYENFANSYDSQIVNLFYQNQRLKESRDILLPRLMDGSIEV